jgi:hypothetical protein
MLYKWNPPGEGKLPLSDLTTLFSGGDSWTPPRSGLDTSNLGGARL